MLVGEPWHLSIEQIKRLTPWQVRHIYFHKRDEQGKILLAGAPDSSEPRGQRMLRGFYENCKAMGLSEKQAAAKFVQYLDRLERSDV